MTITALLLYRTQTKNTLNAEITSQIQVLKLISSNINQKLIYFNNLTASVYYNNAIINCLEKGQAKQLTFYEKKEIQPSINSLMRTDDMILSLSLMTMSGDTLYWNDGYSNVMHINSLDPEFLQKYTQGMGQVSYLILLPVPISVNILLPIPLYTTDGFFAVPQIIFVQSEYCWLRLI